MRNLIPGSLILFFLASLWVVAGVDSGSPYELKFSHAFHSEEAGAECLNCHGEAENSGAGGDNLLPAMETCADCHDVEDGENCGLCHSNPEEPQTVPRIEKYSALFSHKGHLGAGISCADCHAAVASKASAGPPAALPGMLACMNCHAGKKVATVCSDCHLPGEELRPSSHVLDFRHIHSDLARTNASGASGGMPCMTCHETGYCQECHEGENLDRKTHPLNFAFTHSVIAQGRENDCYTCHSDRQFCGDCHRVNMVMPHSHTAGWAVPVIGGRHADEARVDLENCMYCHESNAEQICQPCHQN